MHSIVGLPVLPNWFQITVKCNTVILCQETVEGSKHQHITVMVVFHGCKIDYNRLMTSRKLTTAVFSTFSGQTPAVWFLNPAVNGLEHLIQANLYAEIANSRISLPAGSRQDLAASWWPGQRTCSCCFPLSPHLCPAVVHVYMHVVDEMHAACNTNGREGLAKLLRCYNTPGHQVKAPRCDAF